MISVTLSVQLIVLVRYFILLSISYKERKCGGTSASRDENGQVDVWR